MKLIFLSCIVLFIIPVSKAQNEMPEFGQFRSEDISLKECDFDKEADAVILFHVANSNYNDQHNLTTSHRIRFKILKQNGIDKANIEIPYYSKEDFENISDVHAVTYTLADNGEPTLKELDKKAVFRQKINENFSILKFTLPNVKVGTIVDYSYDFNAKTYGGLEDWYFQSDMPTVFSRYSVSMVPNAEFTYVVRKAHDIPIKITSDKNSGTMYFEMNNIGGLRYEPYMDASRDYLQHVEFQFAGYLNIGGSKVNFMTTWKESAQQLLSEFYFGKQIDKNLPNSEEIIAKIKAILTEYDRMKFIYDYVRNNFTWNNINSKFADDGIKDVWVKKAGTSGEINLILINLLKQAGIQVSPMLVSDRDHGKVSVEYPIIAQFNKVVAYTTVDNRRFVLDATSINTPVNLIPFNILNTNAFIVNNKKPEVIKLTNEKSASNFINIYSAIDNNGLVTGFSTINSYNYAKTKRLEEYKENKEKFRHDYFEKNYAEIRIDSFEISNIETDSIALQQQFKFSMPSANSGDYKLVNTNLFSELETNPFISDSRFSDVDFGCIHRTDINESFELPPAFKPEEIPKNIQLVMPDKSISFIRIANLDNNVITIQMSLKINRTLYSPEDYPILKEFYKRMYNILSEQIVLSNK